MSDPSLSPPAERLILLAEECSEVIQIISKILRFGYSSSNPKILNSPLNRELLEQEIAHVQVAIMILNYHGEINGDRIKQFVADKLEDKDFFNHFYNKDPK